MSHDLRIAVVPGDGIGVEVTAEAVRALEAVAAASGRRLRLQHFEWGADHYLKTGITLPADALTMLPENFDAILLGAMGDPRVPDNRHAADILLGLRFRLDLYVNYRPVRLFHEKLCPLKDVAPKDVDFVVFRENTEGPVRDDGRPLQEGHAGRGGDRSGPQHAQGRRADHPRTPSSTRGPRGRTKVVMADKSNVLIHAHELWLRVFKRGGGRVPGRSRPATSTSDNAGPADGARPGAVPGRRDQQHVRRHRHRPRRRRCRAGWAWPPPATSIPAA